MEEKRKYQRYLAGLSNFIVRSAAQRRACGYVNDFSLGGISFYSNEFFREESEQELELKLSALDRSIAVVLRIIWGKPACYPCAHIYGAEFVKIDPTDKHDIFDALLKH